LELKEYVKSRFPEIERISDVELREKTVAVWAEAMKRGGWTSMDDVPFTQVVPGMTDSLIEHTRRVTRMAIAVGETRDDLNMDLLISSAILHDVGKALEYERGEDGEVKVGEFGRRIRHPVSGAALAYEMGLPYQVVHAIAAHSKEGEFVYRTPEAVVVYHCDFIDFEVAKSKRGLK